MRGRSFAAGAAPASSIDPARRRRLQVLITRPRAQATGLASELEARGHVLGSEPRIFGGYQAILWDEEQGVYYGASEVRKDGQAAGF